MRRALRWASAFAAAVFVYVAYVYVTLPDVRPLVSTNPSTTAFMTLRTREAQADGREMTIRHRPVAYGQISSSLKRAVLVAEDSAFFEHEGIDLEQIRASLEMNWEEGRFARGASTITQQLAKNLYLSPSRNPVRKLKELLITRRLEAELSKRRILEIYLNVIEWGDGIFGCEAASRAYFDKPASALVPSEAALLAGAIINPRELNPARPSIRLSRRQQIILRRMRIRAAESTPATPPPRLMPGSASPADRSAPPSTGAPPA
ncbi:MAG: monofunctional biosynthetic peptidoglycan transglycosylase [Vicinamibacterales bacterium]